ncbi:hypothetical protein HYU15_00430 [Candidatus Woesearchaeota archaeon]|nr:hypothetical protein [Candidatus Woesearchaeota archaeon]
MPAFFTALSVIGIMVGVFLVSRGVGGHGIGATVTLIIGIFVTVKEIMDLIFAK